MLHDFGKIGVVELSGFLYFPIFHHFESLFFNNVNYYDGAFYQLTIENFSERL